jgi:cytoskeletal protein CcmA (bactofilin family)
MSMWKRKEEEPPKPVSAPPRPFEPAKEGIPMSTLPTRPSEPIVEPSRGGSAVLGKSVVVKGQIFSREDLTIDGQVEGSLELQEHRLTIGPSGKVLANVKAREVVVMGTLNGNVETTEKLEIRKEAKLVGDIKTARIAIEDGAYFKGTVDIIRAEISRPAAAPTPKPQAVAGAANVPTGVGPAMAAGAGDVKR